MGCRCCKDISKDSTRSLPSIRPGLASSRIPLHGGHRAAPPWRRETDAELPKPVWFNVFQFPQALLSPPASKAQGGGKFDVVGKPIKGVRRCDCAGRADAIGGTTTATGSLPLQAPGLQDRRRRGGPTPPWWPTRCRVTFKLALTGVGSSEHLRPHPFFRVSTPSTGALPCALLPPGRSRCPRHRTGPGRIGQLRHRPDTHFVTFEINHFGASVSRGRFDKKEGTVQFDRAGKTGRWRSA